MVNRATASQVIERVDSELTVLIPHYNCAQYLGAAVESVLTQDFRDLVLIVVDDHSPDDAWRRVLARFANDRRLVVYQTSRNVGDVRIKNAVLPSISSPFIGFHDADDISRPDRFRRQVKALAADRADLIGCHIEYIDPAGRVTGRRRMPRNGNILLRLGRSTVLHHPATTIRRTALERLGGLDLAAGLGADTDLHLRAGYLFRLRNIPRVLYQYRIRPGSQTQALETGFGSSARLADTEKIRQRERARRRARSRDERLALLTTTLPNDIDFTLTPVPLT